ncbi:MAG: phosphopyruvate hydratase [Candidatus Andersenbacteria bacterium RIFCSPHIGHO2_12_FULL_46_9]|nr:MAG: Enolase [Parcubacteria group bacterium GW2011_GWA2_45_14]OGY35655.1 MAG: phosphopyruvate hydratase [Candidatus Andersenbacteria bacterium RIFCSPHIGHO2_02_FULL_46_16]OGY36857.1 MAG: phosphopyruvate hydratase [Candidatus Andersenbacteria bacterium RIFCSPLOWO2_02_FULL_46_11]OGY37825.1 MAG: phosphopyruvate hydratase [Candidatus Andersenbacteria bacterium RIFCSPHIGHO2_12_FULL_46_9]OGY41657.1 MAG: phosphopyruvate hydratase [Candidatus Andersenbacteria bacterium RIFCSPLOWO2_12_FULL_45_8]HBE90
MPKIEKIVGREILDSRGHPTVEAVVLCEGGMTGAAMVPAGASTGRHEAVELRDNDEKRHRGKGVLKAVGHIEGEIYAALLGQDTANIHKVDRMLLELDGTTDKSRLGANAILAVSLACARAEAAAQGLPLYLYLKQIFPNRPAVLPVPQMNLINGGKHASNNLSIQEYHLLPIGSPTFSEALRMGVEIYFTLRDMLVEKGFQVEVADEGGFGPKLENSETAFNFLVRAIEKAGYIPGVDAFLGIDAAASEFYDNESNQYMLDGQLMSAVDLAFQYKTWRERYPIISIEDPFAEDMWDDWKLFTAKNGDYLQVVGDDLYATNSTRIREGIVQNATNAVLIKPNQVGTLTETMQAIVLAQEAQQNIVISHRSGETEDAFIADLCVAVGAGQIKTGAPSRSDRTSKYNRLLAIEQECGGDLSHDLQPFLEKTNQGYEIK